jgi:hypothetical protein
MFNFTTILGDSFELKAVSYKQDYRINYSLTEQSDTKYYSDDRGPNTDRFSTTLEFGGKEQYVIDLIKEVNLLRDAKLPIVLNDIPEPIFGALINHSTPIEAVITSVGSEIHPSFGITKVSITLLANNDTLIFNTSEELPDMCLRNKYNTNQSWNIIVTESYDREVYYSDHEADSYGFDGFYILNVDDLSQLLTLWRNSIRGNEFIFDEAVWSNSKPMFGGKLSDIITHKGVIEAITYEKMSVNLFNVNVKVLRNGN